MFKLPPLPYEYDALEPTISAETLEFHHDKHHKAYVDKTNQMLKDEGRTAATLEEVVKSSQGKLFNNAAQAWNHAFFWECMTGERQAPAGKLAEAITSAYGDLAGLKKAFVEEGANHFASGWAWIIADESGQLKVISTHDADTPIAHGQTPILVCDVWEHAYYLDYQNDRKSFIEEWFDKVANWRFAENQLRALMGQGELFRYPAPEEKGGENTTRETDQTQTGPGPA
jgi:superoxide dismutase, Fe-Mn family